jgi:hypothetical protein
MEDTRQWNNTRMGMKEMGMEWICLAQDSNK